MNHVFRPVSPFFFFPLPQLWHHFMDLQGFHSPYNFSLLSATDFLLGQVKLSNAGLLHILPFA